MTVTCPKCKSTDIREKNIAVAELPVWGWEWDVANDQPQPADYDFDVSPEWEVDDVANQYVCHDCDWRGTLADLRVIGRPSVEPNIAAFL